MNNYEAIVSMPMDRMECFLDQVFLAGLNTGMYAAAHKDDSVLDHNPFDSVWLTSPAEEATAVGSCGADDEYMLDALTEAILRSAGLLENECR